MKRCFYHTEFVQNAVVHNFSRQIAKHALTFSETVQKIYKIKYTASRFRLAFDQRQICKEILKELRFHMIKDLLCLFFIHGFRTMCNLKKRLIRAAF